MRCEALKGTPMTILRIILHFVGWGAVLVSLAISYHAGAQYWPMITRSVYDPGIENLFLLSICSLIGGLLLVAAADMLALAVETVTELRKQNARN